MDISFHDDSNEFQTKWVEILNDKQANILICVVYRHPRNESTSIFNNHIEEKLSSIKTNNKNIVVVGDFNYCLLKYEKDKNVKMFVDIMYENISSPSRIINGQKPSIVDNIFINIKIYNIRKTYFG